MSRIGKKPVQVPAGVTASVDGQTVTVKGPKGELNFVVNSEVLVKLEDNTVAVTPANDSKDARAKWGMSRTMIENLFKGVKDGYERKLYFVICYEDQLALRTLCRDRLSFDRGRNTSGNLNGLFTDTRHSSILSVR